MKKNITLFTFLFLFGMTLHAQTYQWSAQFGGNDTESGEDIAVDQDGNVYMLGIFWNTADFDPGPGTFNITSNGAQDVYVVKLDANKNFIWAVSVGGTQQDFAYSIRVYQNSIYLAGNFRGTVDFNPGAGMDTLVSAGGSDIFVLKLDTSSAFVWVKHIGDVNDDVVEKLTLDNNENVLVCGEFMGTVDFDPGPNVQNFTSSTTADAYILKLDPSGGYVWMGHFGNNQGQLAQDIVTDAVNDVYLTGQFYGTIDFDPGANVFNMSTTGFWGNIFVLKWTSTGNFVWAVNMGNSNGGDQGTAIEVDGAGNPVVTGSYIGTVDFDPGANVFNLTALGTATDIFLMKLQSGTGDLVFAKSMGGMQYDQPYCIDLNVDGDIFIGGFFTLLGDFDPDTTVYNLTGPNPAGDIFLAQYDTAGRLMWAAPFGSTDSDYMRGLTTDGTDVYSSGVFVFTVDFDAGIGIDTLESFSHSSDAFLLKMGFCATVRDSQLVNLCPGDSIFVGGSFQLTPGIYIDSLISSMGCDSIMTSTVQYTYQLDAGNDVDTCSGIDVLLDAGVPGAGYLWNTGDTTASILADTAGVYTVTVNYNGCIQSDSIAVSFMPLPDVSLGNDTLICINHSITIDAGPGMTGYIWHDGSTGQTFTMNPPLVQGSYSVSVTVVDANGCTNADTIIVMVSPCTAIFCPEPSGVSVYPQPASDYLFIRGNEMIQEIVFFTLEGRELERPSFEKGFNIVKIPTGSLENGIYLLQIKGTGFQKMLKLIVQH